MRIIQTAEKGIPASVWDDLPAESVPKYVLMLREARADIAKQGLYNKTGLNIIKKARCNINPADAECSTKIEVE